MDKTQPFFDPYNFSNVQQQIPNMQMQPNDIDIQNASNPAMYYEQQYMYYRYLTQLLDYKIKLKEWEKMNRENVK